MNTHDHNQHSDEQRAFDEALRERHGEAVAHISARTQAQLQQRRRAALSGSGMPRTTMRRFAWPVATSFAAILALAIGVQLRPDNVAQAPMPIAAVVDDDDSGASFAALDENPDLYLWLASSDAVAFASE